MWVGVAGTYGVGDAVEGWDYTHGEWVAATVAAVPDARGPEYALKPDRGGGCFAVPAGLVRPRTAATVGFSPRVGHRVIVARTGMSDRPYEARVLAVPIPGTDPRYHVRAIGDVFHGVNLVYIDWLSPAPGEKYDRTPDLCARCDASGPRGAHEFGARCSVCEGPMGPGDAGREEHADCDPDDQPRPTLTPAARARLDAKVAEYRPEGYGGRLAETTGAMLDAMARRTAGRMTVDPETPARMARALGELIEGYDVDDAGLRDLLKSFPKEGGDGGMVVVRDVPFASLCEHHVLPFRGTVSVAYIPGDRIVGLSKIPRLVRAVTRRLQVQERIGQQIGQAMQDALAPLGVMVVVSGRHTCMAIRGAESPGGMVTSFMLGVFRDKDAARAEALALMGYNPQR